MIRELTNKEYNKIVNLGKLLKDNYSSKQIGDLEKVYIYVDNESIYGFIQVLSLYETLEIINIVVHPEQRKKGIGKMLLDFVIDKFKPVHILLEVRESNYIARSFYLKNNFTEIRTIKNYYGNENAIVMERNLYE